MLRGMFVLPGFPQSSSHNTTLYKSVGLENRGCKITPKSYFDTMSAIVESGEGPIEVIQVLFALHPSFGAQELCGPLEVLSNAYHKIKDPGNAFAHYML